MKPTVILIHSDMDASKRKLLGMSLMDRLKRSCLRDGAEDVLFLEDASKVAGPFVLMPTHVVGTPDAFRPLLADTAVPQQRAVGDGVVARLDAWPNDNPMTSESLQAWVAEQKLPSAENTGFLQTVTTKQDARAAERALIQSLRKSEDGLISRTLNRPLSLATTRLLARTPITPNQWTIFIGIMGLVGAWMMAQGGYWWLTLGALTVHISSVLDGCDGELARIKFLSSRIGEWLDTAFDDIVNSAMILGLGLGLEATTGNGLYGVLAFAAYAMYLTATVIIYHELITKYKSGYVLDFTWWFEKENEGANTMDRPQGVMDTLKLCMRRDFYILFFLGLIACTLAPVAFGFAFVAVCVHFSMAIIHKLAG